MDSPRPEGEGQQTFPLENILEACIFANKEPLSLKNLHKAAEYAAGRHFPVEEVEAALERLRQRYASTSLELVELAGGYTLRTRPDYGEVLAKVLGLQQPFRLSKPLLETLAIIAYHQPVTRPFINHLRGIQSDYAVEKLLELELIEPAGRADLPGKPLTYQTTPKFLEVLGLRSLADMPRLSDLTDSASLPEPTHIHPPEEQSQ